METPFLVCNVLITRRNLDFKISDFLGTERIEFSIDYFLVFSS